MGETVPIGNPQAVLGVILIVLAVLGVAFFSSAEISMVALNQLRVRYRAEQGHKGARAAQRVAARPDKFFASILLTENTLIIFASSLGTALFIAVLGNSGISVGLSTVLMTLLIVTFGEITPKTLARRWADVWGLLVARGVDFIIMLETPVIYVFTLLPRALQRWLGGGEETFGSPLVTEAELRMFIDISEEQGTVERLEGELLDKVIGFGERPVREVMTPRSEMRGVEEGTTFQELLAIYVERSHTRFPIYQGSLDQITAVLSIKDVLLALAQGSVEAESPVTGLARPAYFVPETKKIGQLFTEMRAWKTQMVMVVDEFGGTAGLVTLKRLVEEVMGPVGDELVPDQSLEAVDEHTYHVAGRLHLERAREELGLELPEGPYETIAGFILHRLGHIPKEGEQVRHGGWRLVVARMEGLRIERVQVTQG